MSSTNEIRKMYVSIVRARVCTYLVPKARTTVVPHRTHRLDLHGVAAFRRAVSPYWWYVWFIISVRRVRHINRLYARWRCTLVCLECLYWGSPASHTRCFPWSRGCFVLGGLRRENRRRVCIWMLQRHHTCLQVAACARKCHVLAATASLIICRDATHLFPLRVLTEDGKSKTCVLMLGTAVLQASETVHLEFGDSVTVVCVSDLLKARRAELACPGSLTSLVRSPPRREYMGRTIHFCDEGASVVVTFLETHEVYVA